MALHIGIDEWRGLVRDRVDPDDAVTIVVLLGPSPCGGGSKPFLAVDDQRRRWWLKVINNPQGGRVLVTDHVIGRVGSLIDAPVCEVVIVRISPELAGFEYAPGRHLEPGLAHASRHIEGVLEIRGLVHREEDDNRGRHAGIFVLYDWCWGSDDQWLYSETNGRMIFSHDRGHYLFDGPNWSIASLVAAVDQPHTAPYTPDGLGCPLRE